ncbi:MAG: hypothetical protein Fur0022_31680 [Anaerolineales bacterium]
MVLHKAPEKKKKNLLTQVPSKKNRVFFPESRSFLLEKLPIKPHGPAGKKLGFDIKVATYVMREMA